MRREALVVRSSEECSSEYVITNQGGEELRKAVSLLGEVEKSVRA